MSSVNGFRNKSVVCLELNRNHKSNVLTPIFMGEVERFLRSYSADETVRAIWLQSNAEDNIFSKGIDYLYLAHANDSHI